MNLQKNISLKPYNTFGMDMPAEALLEVHSEDMLAQIAADKTLPENKTVLGGGSNVLLTQPVNGLLLLNRLKGITIEKEDDEYVWLKVSSGEVWHELVLYAIQHGYAGIENLALIPGTTGAAPMQNIGAYGVEVKDTIDSVTAWHWDEEKFITYQNADCNFGYRDSVFKNELKGKVFITSVVFKLRKKAAINTSYGAIEQELQNANIAQPTITDVANAVIAIRQSKLPDPKVTGNAGSFFKNPTIPLNQYAPLKEKYADMPSYPMGDDMVKVPAGWLIESLGWKGKQQGNAAVHSRQALVLVNYTGNAKGEEVYRLSEDILKSVKETYGIDLEREVQIW